MLISLFVSLAVVIALNKISALKAERSALLALVPIVCYLIYIVVSGPAALAPIAFATVPAVLSIIYIGWFKSRA